MSAERPGADASVGLLEMEKTVSVFAIGFVGEKGKDGGSWSLLRGMTGRILARRL